MADARNFDTIVDSRDVAAGRKMALVAARAAFACGRYGSEHRLRSDTVVYLVERDGVTRIINSDAGRNLSERLV
jgi:hypothetical protein